jgi:hypothetical protein
MTLTTTRLAGVGLLMLGIAVGTLAQAPSPDPLQVQAPVFRGGTYVVPVGLSLVYNKRPWTGLTVSEITVVFDKAVLVPMELQPDERVPNLYTVFFQPPESARDGKAHVLQIRVKKPGSTSWTTLPFKKSITLPPRDGGSGATLPDVHDDLPPVGKRRGG